MNSLIATMSVTTKRCVFFAWLGACLLLAALPPLYLASSHQRALFLGMPWAIAYWLVDAVLLVLGIFALMHVERVRGEFGDGHDNDNA